MNTTRRYDEQYDNRNWGLKQYWGEVELRHITATAVQTCVAKMVRAGVSAATVQARFKAFQTVLAGGTIGTRKRGTSALKEGLIARNPCVGIELPFVPRPDVRVYTPDQVDHLLPFIDEWYRPIPLFLAETAVRWGEMLGLQVDDFALGFRSFVVRRTILEPGTKYTHNGTPFEVQPYPKSKRPRMVKLSRPAATGVQALIAARGLGPGDRVFTAQEGAGHGRKDGGTGRPCRSEAFPEGHPIGRANFRNRVWVPAIKAAGLPYRKVHQLRASNISWLFAMGTPLPEIMQQVGHKQLGTTQLYSTALPDRDDKFQDDWDAWRGTYG